MVTKFERNIWYSIIGSIYSFGIYKYIKNYKSITKENYTALKNRTNNFFSNNKINNFNYIYLDNFKKIVIITPIEDNILDIKITLANIKNITYELTPDNFLLEKNPIQ